MSRSYNTKNFRLILDVFIRKSMAKYPDKQYHLLEGCNISLFMGDDQLNILPEHSLILHINSST